jgi:hypothetical protein
MNAWLQQHGFRYKRPHLVPSKHNPAKQQGFIDEITPIMASGGYISTEIATKLD